MTSTVLSSWSTSRMGDITTKIGSGATPRGGKESYKEAGVSLIRSLNVYDFRFDYNDLAFLDNEQAARLSNVEVQPQDILLNITGASVARCCMVPAQVLPARVNQHVAIVRVDPTVCDPAFVFYCINSPDYKHHLLTLAQGGATREALTKQTIADFHVPVPPLSTQRKIASVLSAYDDLIENNTRRIEILEEMAQRIYREWFVHFRFPGHQKVGTVESELGPIPEGWQVKKVSEVASVHRGRSYKSAEIVEESGLPFLTLKCVDRDGGFRREGIKRYKGPYKETQTAKSGDIIMAVTDMTQERRIIARAARVPATGQDTSVFSMDLVKIEPDTKVAPNFLYGMLRFSTFPDEVKQQANGANVLHLNPSHIGGYDFVLPPAKLCSQYAEICSDIYRESDILHLKNSNLRRTRNLLLPKLISGEVSVEDFDVDPEEVSEATFVK